MSQGNLTKIDSGRCAWPCHKACSIGATRKALRPANASANVAKCERGGPTPRCTTTDVCENKVGRQQAESEHPTTAGKTIRYGNATFFCLPQRATCKGRNTTKLTSVHTHTGLEGAAPGSTPKPLKRPAAKRSGWLRIKVDDFPANVCSRWGRYRARTSRELIPLGCTHGGRHPMPAGSHGRNAVTPGSAAGTGCPLGPPGAVACAVQLHFIR